MAWPFDQSPDTAAITTRAVLERKKEIRCVVHYADDHSWAFLCGTTDKEEDGRVISMSEALEIDNSLLEVADLLPGWAAWRQHRGAAWKKSQNEKEA